MPDFKYADFYRDIAVKAANEVAVAAEDYAADPCGRTWARLMSATDSWQNADAVYRALDAHKL